MTRTVFGATQSMAAVGARTSGRVPLRIWAKRPRGYAIAATERPVCRPKRIRNTFLTRGRSSRAGHPAPKAKCRIKRPASGGRTERNCRATPTSRKVSTHIACLRSAQNWS